MTKSNDEERKDLDGDETRRCFNETLDAAIRKRRRSPKAPLPKTIYDLHHLS